MGALKKYNGLTEEEYLKMDLAQVQTAIEVSGMPKEVADKIWQDATSEDYVEKALKAAKG